MFGKICTIDYATSIHYCVTVSAMSAACAQCVYCVQCVSCVCCSKDYCCDSDCMVFTSHSFIVNNKLLDSTKTNVPHSWPIPNCHF